MSETVRIAMWSGPRNISTAMMRAWDSRKDTAVMDEPFYGAYLQTTGLPHPMAAEIIAEHDTDWDRIANTCATRSDAPILYQKHMTQHMIASAPIEWVKALRHAFLIRPPAEVAASFHDKWDAMRAEDLGFHRQAELFDQICNETGQIPPVIEARDVLSAPGPMLSALCARLKVPFDPAMLSWAAGPRPSDGVWAAHWYGNVLKSTAFGPPRDPAALRSELIEIVEACEPPYRTMAAHALKAA